MLAARDLPEADDETLAIAARDGDHLAFGELYRRYHPVVAGYVRTRIGGSSDDVVQNVFLAILRGLPSYRGPRFFSWAYRICVNVVVDELRRHRRRGLEVSGEVDGVADAGVATPEEELIARRLLSRLSGALARLPEGQRTVFVMARVQGLEYQEIADLLGIPVGTVKSRMWSAVRALIPAGGGVSP